MLQAVVIVHKTVMKENSNYTRFIVIVLLYNLAIYYQNRFIQSQIL